MVEDVIGGSFLSICVVFKIQICERDRLRVLMLSDNGATTRSCLDCLALTLDTKTDSKQ